MDGEAVMLGGWQEAEFVKDEELWRIRGKEEELSGGGVGKTLSVSVQTDHALGSMKLFKHWPPPVFCFFLVFFFWLLANTLQIPGNKFYMPVIMAPMEKDSWLYLVNLLPQAIKSPLVEI